MIREGRVRVDGRVQREPTHRVDLARDAIEVDGRRASERAARERRVYLALNKPRGLVTTRDDPRGRETVYQCLDPALPFVSPIGRLDKASEGLLLFTNDTRWAARLTDPASHVDKTYHVQVSPAPDAEQLARMREGVVDPEAGDEPLRVKRVEPLRQGTRTAWLEVVLDEGRNRHIRRLLAQLGLEVLRLVRVAIGPLALGDLAKGETRFLTAAEVAALGRESGGT